MVARDYAGARAAAKKAEQAVVRGEALPPLHGLPIGIKDLEEAAGMPTTWGSPIFRNHVSTEDKSIVAGVRRAGAIVLGKTNVPEWGAGANTRNTVYGACGNPFDPTKSAAGSSGGSAVALATGMVPLATGSDTGGSLRNPAAFCGIVGFRPTPGLVPSEKRLGWTNLSVLGPMARTIGDTALLLSAMVSDDARDPLATTIHGRRIRRAEDFYPIAPVDLSRLRVALTPDFGFAPTERHIAEVFAEKCGRFRHTFARADDATPDCAGANEAFEVLRAQGFLTAQLERVRTRPNDVGPNIRANVEEALRYTAEDTARAHVQQTGLYRRWQEFYKSYDVVLSPSITVSPRPWSELLPRRDRWQAHTHLLPLARPCLRRDATGASRRQPAGGTGPQGHAVRLADRRPPRRRRAGAVGCGGARIAAVARRAHRAPGARHRPPESRAPDPRDGGIFGLGLKARGSAP